MCELWEFCVVMHFGDDNLENHKEQFVLVNVDICPFSAKNVHFLQDGLKCGGIGGRVMIEIK